MAAMAMHRGLPSDIEYSILLRLPVKTLTRFKCVSKPWYFLLSSPHFQSDHLVRSLHNPLLLTLREDDEDPLTLHFSSYSNTKEPTLFNSFSKKLPYRFEDIRFIESCIGFVCVASANTGTGFILICNPSTEDVIYLPQAGPDRSTQCIGFGYAASTREFKVFSFSTPDALPFEDENFCEVFTLGTAHWREARNPPPYTSYGVAPFLHGALHLPPNGHEETDYIAAFDVDTEEYKCIPLPTAYLLSIADRDISNNKFERVHLIKLRGSLCVTVVFGARLEIWLLKDYKNAKWVKEYNIDMSSLVDTPAGYYVFVDAIGIMRSGSVLLKLGDELWCYDPQDGITTLNIDMVSAAVFYIQSFYPVVRHNFGAYMKA